MGIAIIFIYAYEKALFESINACAEPVAILFLAISTVGAVTVKLVVTEKLRVSDEVSELENDNSKSDLLLDTGLGSRGVIDKSESESQSKVQDPNP